MTKKMKWFLVVSVTFLFSNHLYSGENGLVGYWEFNQGKGNIARDSSGKGNDGTIKGAKWVEGKVGKALEFDGVDDYVDCGNDKSLNITGAITIEAWVKFADVNQAYQHILEKGPYQKGGFRIFWNYAGSKNKFYFTTSDGKEHGGYSSKKDLQNNVWYHITCVDNLNKVYFYLNAQRETLYSGTHTITEAPSNLYIGKRSSGNFFNGVIDEVRIYSRALTRDEIENHYKTEKPQMKELNIKRETMNGKFIYRGNKPILTVGKLKVEFTPKGGWTIRCASYDGNEILSPTGASGAVVNGWVDKDGVKHRWTGTGHGGEIVENLTLIADNSEHVLIANGKNVNLKDGFEVIARKFSLQKRSKLGPYIHKSILTFDGETIQEDFKFKVEGDDSTVSLIYAFMHCFTNSTDSWVVGLKDGIRKGKFKDDNSQTLQEDVRWIGIYSEKLETGIVYIYPKIYKGKGSKKNFFWNRPRDNKLYLEPIIPSGKGKDFSFQVTLWFFKAEKKDWCKKLEEILEKFNIKVAIPKNSGGDK